MTRKSRQLNRMSSQGRRSALALTLCLVLALGAGLIAANPAAASIFFTDLPDVTINTSSVVGPPITLPAGYNLDVNGDGTTDFNLNVFSITYSGSYKTTFVGFPITVNYTASGQTAGMGDPQATPTNFLIGHTQAQTVPSWLVTASGLIGTPITSPIQVPIIDRLALGTPITSGSNYISPFSLAGLNVNLGGFAGNAHVRVSSLFGINTADFGPYGAGQFVSANGATGERGYVGFSFVAGDGIHYGWLDVALDYSNGVPQSLTLYDYAYETQLGVGILAGAVPLPPSVLLLGSGLMGLGLLGWRRRRSG